MVLHLAWSPEEAGNFLSCLRFWIDKKIDTTDYLKKHHKDKSHAESVLEILTSIRRFNQTAARGVLKQHKSLQDLSLIHI